MKILLNSLIFTLLTSVVFSQDKKDEPLISNVEEWYEGRIMLNDGTEHKGLVWYNDKSGVLSVDTGNEKKVFSTRSVAGFEFFDESIQKQRVFYTFEFADSRTNVKRPLFFEVLREFRNFAVLVKADQLEVKEMYSEPASQPTFYDLDALGHYKDPCFANGDSVFYE